MGVVDPKFPDQIWNGLSANPDRINRAATVDPNSQDWDRIAAEILAIQEYVLGLPVTPIDGDKFSLYSTDADEIIQGGQWLLVKSTGGIVVANKSTDGRVSGLALTGGGIGATIVYLRQGRVVSADWTVTTGAVSLVPGAEYYLTTSGGMSVTAPSSGYIVKVGQAQNQTTFDIDIHPSIRL